MVVIGGHHSSNTQKLAAVAAKHTRCVTVETAKELEMCIRDSIQPRPLHRELALLLKGVGYQGFVSLEMKAAGEEELTRSLEYVAEVFG